jgi:two-component system KDP operon response regulator KdpE
LRVYVRQVREKLKDSSAAPRFLITVPGVGYRFKD